MARGYAMLQEIEDNPDGELAQQWISIDKLRRADVLPSHSCTHSSGDGNSAGDANDDRQAAAAVEQQAAALEQLHYLLRCAVWIVCR